MAKMFWDNDTNPRALEGKRIAVLGYGSQGRAHALNLRDSKLNATVGLRRGGPSWKQAEQDGWKLTGPAEAAEGADVIVMLAPDMAQPALYHERGRAQPERRRHDSCFRTDSIFITGKSRRRRRSTSPWSRRKAPEIWCGEPMKTAAAFRACWLFIKMLRATRSIVRLPTRTLSAARAPA